MLFKKFTLSIICLTITFGFLTSFNSIQVSAQTFVPSGEFIPSELVIMLKDGHTEASLRSDNRIAGHKLKGIGNTNIFKLELSDEKLRDIGISAKGELNTKLRGFNTSKYATFLQEIKSNKSVLAVEPNYIYRLNNAVEDESEDYAIEYPLQDADDLIDQSYERAQASSKIVRIAIMDTHINGNHPILRSKILRDSNGVVGYDFIEDDADPFSTEGKHGSMVASIAVGNPDVSSGFSGGSCQTGCMIIPITVCAVSYCSLTAGLNGINFAAQHDANIINMSFGGYSTSVIEERLMEKMYREKGIVFVAAAGNDSSNAKYYPAANIHTISVGALDSTQKARASFSNYGNWVDVAAAGSSVKGLYGNKVATGSGSSYAAPKVAGIIGKYLLNSNSIRSYQIERIIRTDGHVDFSSSPSVGMGIANYNKMMSSVVNTEKLVYPVGVFTDIRTPGRPNQLIWIPFKIKGELPEQYQITIKDSSGVVKFQQSYSATEVACTGTEDPLNKKCSIVIEQYGLETDIKLFWTITGYRLVDGVMRAKSLPTFPYKIKSLK